MKNRFKNLGIILHTWLGLAMFYVELEIKRFICELFDLPAPLRCCRCCC